MIEPAGVAEPDGVRGREETEMRVRADHAVLVEQSQLALGLEHALDYEHHIGAPRVIFVEDERGRGLQRPGRSEEHTSELQSLMRISYAVFCLKKTTQQYKRDTGSNIYNH